MNASISAALLSISNEKGSERKIVKEKEKERETERDNLPGI